MSSVLRRIERMRRHLAAAVTAVLVLVTLVTCEMSNAVASSSKGEVTAVIHVVSRRLVAGSIADATVVVRNRSGSELHVDGCGVPFAVALHNQSIPATVAWPACARSMTIPEGNSKYQLALSTRYSSCGANGAVECIDLRPPPLPVGRYTLSLYQNPTVLTKAPRSLRVRVVR
jgi:hypothetical protein